MCRRTNTRELALNYRVKLERNAELVSNQTRHKINGQLVGVAEKQERGFRELALNY